MLGHYRILDYIGAGGMGIVYRALDTKLQRAVALKVVGGQAEVDEKASERLLREARTASALNHPSICTVHEVGEAGGESYIAMELVEGQTLARLIGSDGLPPETVIRYGVQIADALVHAHERGVVHRDLKCANVMITPEGRPKVLDFGLARKTAQGGGSSAGDETLTQEHAVAGTLAYMAPEVLRGEPADARSDLWALGVMLFEAVAGSLPFRGSTAFETTSAILKEPVPSLPAHVPPSLAAILQRLLAKQPGERYQRAGEARAALEAIQPGVAGSGAVPTVRVPRRRWLWAASSVPVLAALAWFGVQQWSESSVPASGPRLSDGAKPSANAEANAYYERSLMFAGTAPRNDPQQMRLMLERALEADPKFAAARAMYAFTHLMLVHQGDSNDPSWLYKAEEDARQALRYDARCGFSHTVLAGTYLLQGRKELVPGEIDQALKLNPNDAPAHMWLPLYHRTNGDYDQALQQVKQIIARYPLFWPGRLNLGDLLRERGDTDGAIRELERILEQDPNSRIALWALARVYSDVGDLSKARHALEQVEARHRQNYRARLSWALLLALEGKSTEALREMDGQVLEYAGISYLGPLQAAEFHVITGDNAKALEWMDKAVRMGDDREDWFRRDPLLAKIREHPRFQQILASVAYRRGQRSKNSGLNP